MDFFDMYGKMLINSIVTHVCYVIISVTIGFVLGLIIGILLSRIPKYSAYIFPIVSIFQTIPGIVFIGVLFLYLGMKPVTVIIALSIYAMFPVLKNTYTGILSVDEGYVEAAKGCGMSPYQALFKVELPLAFPNVIAGLRLATVYTISWAVLASTIGLGGLGDFVYQGVSSNNNTLIIAGAIPAAILAVVAGALIDRLQKKIMSRGTRGEAAK
ncbi:MAG: ABC transporter permease [Oscillospiraceae bacterium]|jgi:osmoprotectant transport system permease protein